MQSVDGDVRLSVRLDAKSVKDDIKDLSRVILSALDVVNRKANSADSVFAKLSTAAAEAVKAVSSVEETAKSSTSVTETSLKEIGKSVSDFAKSSSTAMKSELSDTTAEITKAAVQMSQLLKQGINTESYESLEQILKSAESVFEQIANQQEEMANAGETGTKEFNELENAANSLGEVINTVDAKMKEVSQTGQQVGEVSSDFEKAANEIGDGSQKIGDFSDQTTEAQKALSDLASQAVSSFSEMSAQSQEAFGGESSKVLQLENNVQKAAEKIALYQEKLKAFKEQAKPTAEYSSLGKEIDKLTAKYDKLNAKKEQALSEYGEYALLMNSFKDLEPEIARVTSELDKLNAKKQQMETSGTAFKLDEAKYQQFENALKAAYREYDIAAAKLNEFNSAERITDSVTKKLNKSTSVTAKAFTSLGKNIKSAFNSIIRHSKNAAKSAGSSFSNVNKTMSNGIKTLLKYGIGIRSLYALFRKLRSGISEGYKNLATYSSEVNESVSSVLSALTKLKNSLAAAFQPIVNVVAPILTTLIDKLSEATKVVGQFFAMLTGQDYVYQAVKTQTNYVDSLEDTADAAKKAEKALNGYLSPLDEINTYTDPQTDTSALSSGINAEDMFETVEVGNQFKDLAEKIKGYFGSIKDYITSEDWEGLGSFIARGFNKGLQKLKDIVSWDNLQEPITKTINAVTGFINSFADRVDWHLLGETIGEGINTLVNTFDELAVKIDWDKIGGAIANSINGLAKSADWKKLGKTMADNMNILPKTLLGFAKKLDWKDVGNAIGEGIQSLIDNFDLDTLAEAVGTTFSGIVKTIDSAIKKISWKDLAKKIKNGFLSLFKSISFKDIGKLISDIITGALDFVIEMTNPFDGFMNDSAKGIGNAIGDLISNIDWGKIIIGAFQLVGNLIIDALSAPKWIADAVLGLGDSIAGAIFSSQFGSKVTAAFSSELQSSLDELTSVADEVADGINQRLSKIGDVTSDFGLLDQYAQRFSELMSKADLTPAEETELKTIFDYLSENVDGFSGTMGQYVTISDGGKLQIVGDFKEIQQAISTTIEDYKSLALAAAYQELATESAKAYIQAKETTEKANAELQTQADTAGSLNAQMSDLKQNWGAVNAELEELESRGGIATNEELAVQWGNLRKQSEEYKAQAQKLADAAKDMGIEVDGSIESYRDFATVQDKVIQLYADSTKGIEDNNAAVKEAEDEYKGYIDRIALLNGNLDGAKDALARFDAGLISEQDVFDKTGISVDKLREMIEEFGMSGDTVMDELDIAAAQMADNVTGDLKKSEKGFENVKKTADTAALGLQDSTETAGNAFTNLYSAIDSSMNDAAKSVKNNVDEIMKSLEGLGKYRNSGASSGLASILNASSSSGYIAARSAIASAMSSPSIKTGTNSVNTLSTKIPKLAQGAVLPPNKPFLTIMGEQKNGNNLEAPEALIRKIVREEAGGNNSGGSYEFIAQINRRTIFDEIINEAKLRQTINGRNPFELA